MTVGILPPLPAQAQRLIDTGVPQVFKGLTASQLRESAEALSAVAPEGSLLALQPSVCGPAALAPFLTLSGKQGFVVEDMEDVDEFTPVPTVKVPCSTVYAAEVPSRGDALRNWSPEEAAAHFEEQGRTPLLLTEGIYWALQQPTIIAPGACFMTIGSRRKKPDGTFDARTPALWISAGTGRDGKARKGAPKVGWCWWRNRHTWLGFSSTAGRWAEPN